MAVKADWARRVARISDGLSRSESVLLDYIVSHPQDAAFMSLKELCSATGVSKPKVIDLYRKLAYAGFKEFRTGILDFYRQHIDSYRASYTTFRQIASLDELRQAAIQVDVNSLLRMSEHVSSEDLRHTARAILDAQNVYIFGPGTGFYPANFLAERLRRYRLSVHLVESDLQHLTEGLYPVSEGDLFILFHYLPEHTLSTRTLELVKEQGGRCIVVTGTVLLELVDLAERVIYVERGEMGFKNSMAVPVNFANLLLLTVEFLGGDVLQERLKKLEEKREKYQLTRFS